MIIARSVLFVLAVASTPLSPLTSLHVDAAQHAGHVPSSRSAFVEAVRQATERFRDVRNLPAEYGPVLGCVSGPEEGAMGVHFVNPALLMDGALDAPQPEALIYEFKNGAARLVGVEFIVFADVWHLNHAPNDPPVLEGQLLQLTAPIASDCRRITSSTCGRGETTPGAYLSIGTPAFPVKDSDCHVITC